jgi:hypothetical protein
VSFSTGKSSLLVSLRFPNNNQWVKHNRRSFLILFLSIGVILVSSFGSFTPGVFANPDVIANPEHVRYEGSGGLILPATVDSGTRNEVIRCRGCAWKLIAACVPGPENYCDAGIRACPGLIDHMRVWFRPLNGAWKEVDRICLTNYEVTTVNELENSVAETFERYVPEQEARCWPAQGAVTNLPLICQSGQPEQALSWNIPISGFMVLITAAPSWTWDFHGAFSTTRNAGGPFPNKDISHTFSTAGSKNIHVVTRWNGYFSVDSLENVTIERELTQRSSMAVIVGQAKARLRCPGVGLC